MSVDAPGGAFAVGLDVGTSSVKALAVGVDGTVLGREEEAVALSVPRPGWAEQDPADWWRAAERVLARLGASRAAGIGLSGQMHGLVALDAADEPVRPAMLWNDARTAAQCAWIEERVGRSRLVALTGNRALAGFTAPKLRWLADHEPEVLARVAHVLLPKDHVRLRLCGERATDVSDASGTLWFDVGARRWSAEVCELLEVPTDLLPPVLESAEVSGWAFDGRVPVAAGAGDQAAGAVGVGVVGAGGPLSVVLGTSGVVFAATDGFEPDPEARVHAFCHALPESWHTMGVVLSAAGSLRWLHDAVGAPGFDVLLAEAGAVGPGAGGVRFAPYLSGERTPHADPAVRGGFTGLDPSHGRGHLARAVLEGVAHALADGLALVDPDGLATVGRASGGGTRGALWPEVVASVLGLELELCAVDEGAAFGAALLGGVAGGLWGTVEEAVAATVRPVRRVVPRKAWVARYAAERPAWRALYPALAGLAEG